MTLYLTPVVYIYFDRIQAWLWRDRKQDEGDAAADGDNYTPVNA